MRCLIFAKSEIKPAQTVQKYLSDIIQRSIDLEPGNIRIRRERKMNENTRSVLITNGNLPSMIALARWINENGKTLKKVYVTYKLPSSRSNIGGVVDLFAKSGFNYTFMKIWINKIAPFRLRREGLPASVDQYIRHLGLKIPVQTVSSANDDHIVKDIIDLETDLLISFSATHRFSAPLIAAPRLGAINIHYGALPKYAGLSPYYWHLHNKENSYGVTLHRIDEKLDSGGIIEQVISPINSEKTSLGLLLTMADQVSPILNRFFDKDIDLSNTRMQDLTQRTYFRHPSRQQVAEFHRNGFRMMDAQSNKRVFDKTRELASLRH